MKQIKVNDTVKVNSPDMTGIWEVISISDSHGIKTAIVRGNAGLGEWCRDWLNDGILNGEAIAKAEGK